MGGNDSFSPQFSFNASSSSSSSSSSSGNRSSAAPIRLLFFFHKAFRGELQELRRVSAATSVVAAVELKRRLQFFRSVFSYHCAAEDEVIFFALDSRVKNIASTYFLEHQIIDSKFETTFSCLNGIMKDNENPCQEFQELTVHLSALEGSICQHMTKEEQQVFPLLMSQFSDEEQSSLLWQLICSVPIVLMEDFFPWLTYFLTLEEQLDLKYIMTKIVPQDKLLQEVVISWMNMTTQPPSRDYLYNELSETMKDFDSTVKDGPFAGLMLWHSAIKSDFEAILDKLYNKKFLNLASLVVRINFLMDVLIFYGDALERIFYPLLEDVSGVKTSSSYEGFPFKKEFEGFQKIIFEASQIDLVKPKFLKMLIEKVENLAFATSKHLSFHETEVFPLITKKYDHKIQQKLLFKSLLMLPLGLLKCVATWFSPHLSKDSVKYILHIIETTSFLDRPFASLLQKWVHIGYCGKSTMEDLQEMFNSRISFMFQQLKGGKESSNLCDSFDNSSFYSSSLCTKKHGTLYSSGINLLVFSSRESYQVYTFSGFCNEAVSSNYREPRPLDHIYYFHKAIKKDLELLVLNATTLSKNLDLFVEFNRHFRLVRSFYELHSETEDHVAFPALEAKQKGQNLTKSYTLDHNLEDECFNRVSGILDEMSELYKTLSSSNIDREDPNLVKYNNLCLNLQESCQLLEKLLNDHINREEVELWPLFRENFSIEEQERIVGYMLGRTRAEILQKMIVWLMDSLTLEEREAMMNFWRKATKYTKFDEWLGEWWEGMEGYICSEVKKSDNSCSSTKGYLDIVSSERVKNSEVGNVKLRYNETETANVVKKMEGLDMHKKHKGFEYNVMFGEKEKQGREGGDGSDSISELEAAIRKVSQDPSLDLQAKTRIMQDLMTSHWISPPTPDSNSSITSEPGKLPGQFPSYRDSENSVFGCKHYKQNCKLVASCCNQIVSCRRCHDEVSDHVMDRKSITHMMCMKCLEIQPIGPICVSCNNYSMARYYCKICRLFDDSREIYHCPYCNLCRLGKGLGIDYFHCMKCNACMSRSLSSTHICREKCIEDKCPICHEDMFTSRDPVKALPCGHLMHSSCFEDYTCTCYTCPVCSKSLGDMQVLFGMLDALMAEERMPEEYIAQTQAILCNDCEKKGIAPFHWLYHKCPFCGSYNTRLI